MLRRTLSGDAASALQLAIGRWSGGTEELFRRQIAGAGGRRGNVAACADLGVKVRT